MIKKENADQFVKYSTDANTFNLAYDYNSIYIDIIGQNSWKCLQLNSLKTIWYQFEPMKKKRSRYYCNQKTLWLLNKTYRQKFNIIIIRKKIWQHFILIRFIKSETLNSQDQILINVSYDNHTKLIIGKITF